MAKTVSFGGGLAEEPRYMRQRAMADALLQGTQGPISGWGEGVANLAKTAAAGYINNRADTAQKTASQARADALRRAVQSGNKDQALSILSESDDPELQGMSLQYQMAGLLDPQQLELKQIYDPQQGGMVYVDERDALGKMAEGPKPLEAAPQRTIRRDGLMVDQELTADGWKDAGQGPQFAPQQAPQDPETIRLMRAAGIDPQSPEGQALIQSKLAGSGGIQITGYDEQGRPIISIGGPGGKPLTEGQSTGTMQFSLADQANRALGELDTTLTNVPDYIASQFGTPGNFFKSPEYQKAEQSATVMAEQYLRALTGAAAPEPEVQRTAKSILPQPGDGPDVIAQKRATRAQIIEALRIKAGPGAAQLTPGAVDLGTGGQGAPDPGMQGGQDQIGEGTVIVNPQTKERLILKGGQWVPAP